MEPWKPGSTLGQNLEQSGGCYWYVSLNLHYISSLCLSVKAERQNYRQPAVAETGGL